MDTSHTSVALIDTGELVADGHTTPSLELIIATGARLGFYPAAGTAAGAPIFALQGRESADAAWATLANFTPKAGDARHQPAPSHIGLGSHAVRWMKGVGDSMTSRQRIGSPGFETIARTWRGTVAPRTPEQIAASVECDLRHLGLAVGAALDRGAQDPGLGDLVAVMFARARAALDRLEYLHEHAADHPMEILGPGDPAEAITAGGST